MCYRRWVVGYGNQDIFSYFCSSCVVVSPLGNGVSHGGEGGNDGRRVSCGCRFLDMQRGGPAISSVFEMCIYLNMYYIHMECVYIPYIYNKKIYYY